VGGFTITSGDNVYHTASKTAVKQTQPAPGPFEQAVEAIVSRVIDARLRALGVVTTAADYSSLSLPPNVNGRTFARWCRLGRVVGAEPDGRGWRCTVDAWHEARSAAKKRAAKPIVDCADEDIAKAMIAASRRGSK
jgi:hypothetical protein